MSQEHIHELLGLAAVDQEFRQMLLIDPLRAVREKGFTLSPKELKVLSAVRADNLYDLSAYLLEHLFTPTDRDGIEEK